MKVKVDNVGNFDLNDRDFVASGGQAVVYAKGGHAIKVFHDPSKMIPVDKIQELAAIQPDNVLKPEHLVHDAKGKIVGYTMQFIADTVPMCKLFTRSFKEDNNISPADVVELVKKMQLTTTQIHKHKCLIVDGNEMNYLVDGKFAIPYFIDVDSWQTPTHRANALMESVRDRLVKGNSFTELSDWFAFAIVSFQLYIGIHPYKGKHPDYKPKDWTKRMDDGVSVFDKRVTLPPTCYDFSVIPKRHLDWMQDVFLNNTRSIPPLPDGVAPAQVAIDLVRIIKSTGTFDTKMMFSAIERIRDAVVLNGSLLFIGKDHIWRSDNMNRPIDSIGDARRVALGAATDGSPMIAKWHDDHRVVFSRLGGGSPISVANVSALMGRNGLFYTVVNDKLFENEFTPSAQGKLLHSTRIAGNVLPLAGKMFGNMIFQDILGKPWLMIPFAPRKLFFRHIQELDGYRVIDGYNESNVAVIIGEQSGKFTRFVLVFDWNKQTYACRKTEDVNNLGINMAVMPSGVCILMTEAQEIEIFKDNIAIKAVDGTPFDASMRLFARDNTIHFIDKKNIYSVTMKKGS